ncbi:MAG: LysR family transcriptional regulator, partial [Chloroflexota bacterium]
MANPYDTLDLKQLKCFWAMARVKSLTRAGIDLGVTESAVAQRVKGLERHLGLKLYEAPGGRIRLTPAGEKVFEMATALFDQIESFRGDLAEETTGGRLRLAAEESVLLYLLPEPIRRFVAAHPTVELEVLSRTAADSVELVQMGEVDLAVAGYRPLPRSVVFRPWQDIPGYVITPLGHPLLKLEQVVVKSGDTIDFGGDHRGERGWDDFAWAPILRMGDQTWNAEKDFG